MTTTESRPSPARADHAPESAAGAVADGREPDPAAGPGPEAGITIGVRYPGHATVVLDLAGLRIATDPFLRDRLGPLRRRGPTPQPAAIGPVDIVAISHAHPDHFDRASLLALVGDPLVVVPHGLGGTVRRAGLRAREMRVGETVSIAPRWTITAVPARHWRWPAAPMAAAVGYLIEGPGRIGIYFAGDTAPYPAMRELRDRVDLALLPVGSWGPHVSLGHLSPRSAAGVARDIGARFAVPIHWGTLYPPLLERIRKDRDGDAAARFVDWCERLAPKLEVRTLQPGEGTSIRL